MSAEHRRAPRRPVNGSIRVLNSMTGAPLGRVGNLSDEGMMLVLSQPIRDDALYQVAFRLEHKPDADELEVGIHGLWCEQASSPETWWAGFRIIDISDDDASRLKAWLDRQR